MLKPIGNRLTVSKADNRTIDRQTGEYKDPLMKWPLRGAAFTNEVGEALRPIIGSYATLSWAPALLYIGADVYDKYKNDQTEYSPDSRRCLKQAIFQGCASIFLPLIAVKAGQNIFSQFARLSGDKISLNTKEHISEIAEQFIANGKMRAFDGKDQECVKEFLNIVADSRDFAHKKNKFAGFFNISRFDNKEKVKEYSEKTIKDLIKIRKDLLEPTIEVKSGVWYQKYIKGLNKGQTESVAIKSVLETFQKSKLMKGKFVKTIGGFLALGLAIKPIDHFVENVLIDKFLGPSIDAMKKK